MSADGTPQWPAARYPRVDVVELATYMRPTRRLGHVARIQPGKPGIAVGLQHAPEPGQMPARVLAFAVGRVAIEHGRRRRSAVRALVADIALHCHSSGCAAGTFGSSAQSRPVLVLPVPGASTGTGVSSACSTPAAMTSAPPSPPASSGSVPPLRGPGSRPVGRAAGGRHTLTPVCARAGPPRRDHGGSAAQGLAPGRSSRSGGRSIWAGRGVAPGTGPAPSPAPRSRPPLR
jgi:hypothetical protein